MLKSVVVPIIKDKNKHVSDRDNYRLICLSNAFAKILGKILYNPMQSHLQTTCNQFGFKPKHRTEMCVFVLKELLRYHIKHGSCMYVDASKAFDMVNHRKLFSKLLVLSQTTCVKWGSVLSNFFSVNNGVRQGGMLSPFLFNIYMNDLSLLLMKLPIGCCSGDTIVNHLMLLMRLCYLLHRLKGCNDC